MGGLKERPKRVWRRTDETNPKTGQHNRHYLHDGECHLLPRRPYRDRIGTGTVPSLADTRAPRRLYFLRFPSKSWRLLTWKGRRWIMRAPHARRPIQAFRRLLSKLQSFWTREPRQAYRAPRTVSPCLRVHFKLGSSLCVRWSGGDWLSD